MSGKVLIDESDDSLLVGVDGEQVSGSIALEDGATRSDVEETVRTLYQEARHSARIRGRSGDE